MGRRIPGYEYGYRFSIDWEIVGDYAYMMPPWMRVPSRDTKTFVFEIRTNFILKTRKNRPDRWGLFEEKMMDSERYGSWMQECPAGGFYQDSIAFRLYDYWMSNDEAGRLVGDAKGFAFKEWDENDSLIVVPVAVELDVCTVQQEGESISATTDRVINAERMIPLRLFPVRPNRDIYAEEKRDCRDSLFYTLLSIELPRSRVEDAQTTPMDKCSICLLKPTVVAQISRLESYGHVFHTHCVAPRLEESRRLECPSCRTLLFPDVDFH